VEGAGVVYFDVFYVHRALPDSGQKAEQSCSHDGGYEPEFGGEGKQKQDEGEDSDELEKEPQESALFSMSLSRLSGHAMKSPGSAFNYLVGGICALPFI
jgi:hypothetical protein